MFMNSEFRSPMDDEIDAVAQSMTAASPSAALRSGVRARIAGRAGGHVLRWSLGIAVAAAVIVLAIVWPDREATSDAPGSRASVAELVPPAAADRSIEPGPIQTPVVAGRGWPGEPDRVRQTNAELLPGGPVVSVAPLAVEPLADLEPLRLNGIEIQTLTVETLSLEPLSLQ
jgi:hypothetical protein